jgi:hypothetical protein
MGTYIEVHIKEYRRKDGTFVKAHTRTIKNIKGWMTYIRKNKIYDPQQLSLGLSGFTKTNLT